MGRTNTLRRCPHCGKVGTRVEDVRTIEGVTIDTPYCGHCGKNWPPPVKKGKP